MSGAIKDSIGVQDVVTVDVLDLIAAKQLGVGICYVCPQCKKSMKPHHEGAVICSNKACRHIAQPSELKSLKQENVGPRFPCPKCNSETKEHHPCKEGPTRICSNKSCRYVGLA